MCYGLLRNATIQIVRESLPKVKGEHKELYLELVEYALNKNWRIAPEIAKGLVDMLGKVEASTLRGFIKVVVEHIGEKLGNGL